MIDLSPIDKEILIILENDGRTPAAEIARRLNVPPTTVRNRIKRLEDLNVISGYRAIINMRKLGFGIKAIVKVQLESTRVYDDFLRELPKLEEVVSVFVPTGAIDAFVTIWVKDIDHLGLFLTKRINLLPRVIRTNTMVIYKEMEYTSPIRLSNGIFDQIKRYSTDEI
ncbi:MAG: hypothetical protein DRP54_06895 [Spirochaetes bacterium]|nr:MAG: hypothetical protein DRP54_06895 [Spirochaetota bacterium]